MKIKTSELEGAALDYCTALACGIGINLNGKEIRVDDWNRKDDRMIWSPSTDWSQGGQILEKEQIEMEWVGVDGLACGWNAWHQDVAEMQCGPTMLIAACRAIVSANLGDTVDVPEGLV